MKNSQWRRHASQAVSFNQSKGQHSQNEYTCHLTRKIKAASSLRSRWSHIPGGEQKAEDADGKIDQEDAAPPKRVDASVKRARPAKNTVLLPLLSPSAPPVSRKLAKTRAYPSTIH